MGNKSTKLKLGGGFKQILCSSLPGEDFHFERYVSDGLVQPPTRKLPFEQIIFRSRSRIRILTRTDGYVVPWDRVQVLEMFLLDSLSILQA